MISHVQVRLNVRPSSVMAQTCGLKSCVKDTREAQEGTRTIPASGNTHLTFTSHKLAPTQNFNSIADRSYRGLNCLKLAV